MRLVVLLLLFLSPLWLRDPLARLPSSALSFVQGIDISHYQHRIAWDTVAAQGEIRFAFVKATENCDYTDSLFAHNWHEMGRLGIKRGAYHFFRAYGCGYEQAMHFLNTVPMSDGDLLPVLDVERIDGMPHEILLEEMQVWLQTVERQLHCKPIIYTNQNFYERHLAGIFDHYPIWIARYASDRPELSTGKNWAFWQYTHTGRVNGISTAVDLNVFEGTEAHLEEFCFRRRVSALESEGALSAP